MARAVPLGATTEGALTDSVEEALRLGVESSDADPRMCRTSCATGFGLHGRSPWPACSAVVQDVDSTVVLFFTDDEGGFLATPY